MVNVFRSIYTQLVYLAIFGCCIFPQFLGAYSVSNLVCEFTPSGVDSSALITISNPSLQHVPVEITIYEQERDMVTGEIIFEDRLINDEDIYVSPTQMILDPESDQIISLRYVGDPDITTEKVYAYEINQLPISLINEKVAETSVFAEIIFLTRYIGHIFVTPPGAAPNIVVDSVRQEEQVVESVVAEQEEAGNSEEVIEEETEPFLVITLANHGSRRLNIGSFILRVTAVEDETKFVDLDRVAVPKLHTNILSGTKREFHIPWPESLPLGEVKVEIL